MPTQTRAINAARDALPPVPHNLLLPAASPARAPQPHPDPSGLTTTTAARLIGVYAKPGDLVVDLHGTGIVAAAAATTGRRAVTVTSCRQQDQQVRSTLEPLLPPIRRSCATTQCATLTHTPWLLHNAPDSASLILARVPQPEQPWTLREASRWLTACHTCLTPPGYLIAALDPTDPNGDYVDHTTVTITAARAAGFIYHQHLINLTGPIPEPDGEQPPPPRIARGHAHRRIHTDLLVFARGVPHA